MHIGLVTACYKPVVNGVTNMVALHKAYMEAAGHKVSIFTLGNPDLAEEEEGVVRSPAVALGTTGYYLAPRYSAAARRQLQKVDIIHCHHLLMGLEFARLYGRCPIVFTNHTRYDLYMSAYSPIPQMTADSIMRRLWPAMSRISDVVVTPSEGMRQVLLDFGVRSPIKVIRNGVELEQFRKPHEPISKLDLGLSEDSILCIYTGRLSPEKNLDTLLAETVSALNAVPELNLMLLGSGPKERILRQRVERLGLTGRVLFAGAVPYEEVPNYLAAADFYVTASKTEVHPLTIIEAMAAGLPVAAFNTPGVKDSVTNSITGHLVEGKPGSLGEAITLLASDRIYRQTLGNASKTASQRFDIRRTIDNTLRLYEELVGRQSMLRKHGRDNSVKSARYFPQQIND